MLNIVLDNRIRIKAGALPTEGVELLQRRLTFRNPLYQASGALRKRYSDREVTPTLSAIWEDQEGNVVIPRGFFENLQRILHANRIEYAVEDRTRRFSPCGFSGGVGLEITGPEQWPEHVIALREFEKHPFGCLVGAPGSGKTLVACKLIALRQVPTLIVVDGKIRMYAFREKIARFFGLSLHEIGLIGDGRRDLDKEITLAIPLSLYKVIEEIEPRIGFVIVDRCDQSSLNVYYAVGRFASRFLLGLAEGNRQYGGLTRLMWAYLGPRICELPARADLEGKAPMLKIRETSFEGLMAREYRDVVSALCRDEGRNRFIAGDILQAAAVQDRVVVLSERKSQLRDLLRRIQYGGGDGVIVDGQISMGLRNERIGAFNEGRVRVLLATVRSAEPASLAALDTIILAFPIRHVDRLVQLIGKLRAAKKRGIVLDYGDRHPLLRASLNKRIKMFRALSVVEKAHRG
ncbi:MAG: hypothetical protein JRL30_20790 [Deltaproteobacteria bacterium]|nr:hypothetical protein [Deltaproteobacteria bacterium]